MKKMARFFWPLFAVTLLVGCAYTTQQATLSPELQLSGTNIGNNATVAVKVVDERSDKSLGYRGSAYGKAAKITTGQNVAEVIYEKIVEGLKQNGFNPVPHGFNPVPHSKGITRALKVEIRLIEYSTSVGFWTGGVHTKSALKAIAKNNGKVYENLYRVDNEKRIVFAPFAKENEKLINKAVSEVLQKLFGDQELIAFLAR
jgi:uncharacterized lipoprotein YajG